MTSVKSSRTRIGGSQSFEAACQAVLAQVPVSHRIREIQTCFGKTHLVLYGDVSKPPLLLIHGNLSSSLSWLPNIPALSLAHRIIAVDVPGEPNGSEGIHPPLTREDYILWMQDILDGLALETVDMVGISKGGMLAVNYSLRCMERIRRLVLLAPGLPLAPYTFQWMVRGIPMLLFPCEKTIRWFLAGASMQSKDTGPLRELFIAGILSRPVKIVPPPVIPLAELGKLSVPVLLLLGEHEILYSPKDAIRQAMRHLPRVQAELIPKAGHFLNSDQPELVNRRILEFLGSENATGF